MRENRFIVLTLILFLMTISSGAAQQLSVVGFDDQLTLDSVESDTAIIGNSYDLLIGINNTGNQSLNFNSSHVFLFSSSPQDLFNVVSMEDSEGACSNCNLSPGEIGTLTFNWTVSKQAGERTFSLDIKGHPATFNVDNTFEVNSAVEEFINILGDTTMQVHGNYVNVSVSSVNYTGSVFEFIDADYGEFSANYSIANMNYSIANMNYSIANMIFATTFAGHTSDASNDLYLYTLNITSNPLVIALKEYCKQEDIFGMNDLECGVAINESNLPFTNITVMNEILRVANEQVNFRVSNYDFNATFAKGPNSIFAETYYGENTQDIIDAVGDVFNQTISISPFTIGNILDNVTFSNIDKDVQNLTTISSSFIPNGLSTTPSTYTVYFNYTDQYGNSALRQINIIVDNTPPTTPDVQLLPENVYAVTDMTCLAENSTDVDNDAITYQYEWYKNGVKQPSFTTATINSASTKYGQNWTCVATPFDGTNTGQSVTDSTTIQLGNNTPPRIQGNISDVLTDEDTSTSQNISAYRYDLEEEVGSLSWNMLGVNESIFFATIANNMLSISPVMPGYKMITLVLKDSFGGSDSQTINVTITNINEAPTITSTPITTATENEEYTYQVTAVDPDGDSLNYSLLSEPSGMSINSSGYITWTPTDNQAGATPDISIQVTDGLLADTQNYSMYVNPVNDAPTISGVGNQTPTEDVPLTVNISSNVDDVDNNFLEVTTNSTYVTVNGYELTFLYPDGVTSDNVKITVSDGELSASDSIAVTITPVNDAPSTPRISLTPKSLEGGETLTCNVTTPSSDSDSAQVNYTYMWFHDGSFISGTTTTTSNTYDTYSSATSGTYTCNVTATDGINTTETVSDSVSVGNSAPTTPVVDLLPNNVYTGNDLDCNITTNSTDSNNDSITYNYNWYRKQSSQSQYYLQPQTTQTLGNAATAAGDSWKCEVKAYDTKAYSASATDTVTVSNSRPVIVDSYPSGTTATINETTSQVFNVTATDADFDTLSYKWYKGSTVVASGNTYTYTPTYTSAGTYTIKAVVSDGKSTREKSWTLTVNDVNRNPVIATIGNQSCNERQACTIYVSATDADANNLLRYYDNSTMFQIGSSTGNINFSVPSINADMTESVRITVVDDKGGSATQLFNLNLLNVNRKPELASIGTLSAVQDVQYTKQLTATDSDSDTLTYNDNTTLFNITSSGLIQFTPTNSDVGSHAVEITVSDGNGGIDSEDITVEVQNSNDAPTIDDSYPSSSTITLNESQSQYFNVTASDVDNTTPNYKWYKNGDLVSSTQEYTLSTNYKSAGTYTIRAVADDGLENDTQTWTVTVNNINRAPQISSIPVLQATEDRAFSYTVSASDADRDTLVYSTNSSMFTIGVLSGKISFTPTNAQTGTHSIRLFVADGTERKNITFTLNITNVNDAPQLSSIGALTALEGQTFTKTVSATDDDGDALTYSDDTGLFDINSETGVISFTPTFKDAGTYPVRITVRDTNGATDYEDIEVTVVNNNQVPTIGTSSPSSPVSMKEDDSTTFTVSATDPDGTTPSYKWYLDDSAVDTGTTYTFQGDFTEENSNAGTYTVKAIVTDGIANATQTWSLTVNRTRDSDEDLVPDYTDNCPLVYNPGQTDLDNSTSEGLVCENNQDGDDLLDDEDFVQGDAANVDTNVGNSEVEIDNSTDLNRQINETKRVKFKYKQYDLETGQATDKEVVDFEFDFSSSSKLNLGDMTVRNQGEGGTSGSLVVDGVDLSSQGKTKTVYVDKVDSTQDSVCIKDANIAAVRQISDECDAADETKLACTTSGASKTFNSNTYTCTDLGDGKLKVEGLVHSGVKQSTCTASWSCSEWGSCVGGTQTCTGGWVDANSCGLTYGGSNTRSCSTSGSGGTSGGDNYTAKTVKSGFWSQIRPGETKALSIDVEGLAFSSIAFSLNNVGADVSLSIEKVESPTVTKTGKVYQYVEITKENFEDGDVESTVLDFKVPRQWLTDNGVTKENVALFRYTDAWDELDTSVVGENSEYVYFTATTSGFSTFAVGDRTAAEEPAPETEPTDEPTTTEPEQPPVTGDVTTPPEGQKGAEDVTGKATEEQEASEWTIFVSIILALVIAVILIYFILGRPPRTVESFGGGRRSGGSPDKSTSLKKAVSYHKKALKYHKSGKFNKAKKYYKLAKDHREKTKGY